MTEIVQRQGNLNPSFYSGVQIFCGTFFGGVMAGAWLLHSNYLAIGDKAKAAKTARYAVGALLALIILGMFVFKNSAISIAVTVALSFGAMDLFKKTQREQINALLASGRSYASTWKVVGITLASIVATIMIAIAVAIVLSPLL